MSQLKVDEINGNSLSENESGYGESVVLLHSSASSGAQWRGVTAGLEDRFQVATPDLYGYGDAAAWHGEKPLTLADEAALVASTLAQCPGPVHLVGHSYGGAVALRVALDHVDKLRSLTLIEPVAFHLLQGPVATDRVLLDEIHSVAQAVWDAAAQGDYWNGMAGFVDYWNGVGAWANIKEDTRRLLAPLITKVALDFAATFRETTTLDAYRWLDLPALVVCSERSPAPTRRITDLLMSTLPNSRYAVIKNAGHMAPLTHADAVGAAIAEHLSTATSSPISAAALNNTAGVVRIAL
ncbi:MAG: alpha/beta hydrolase [Alphaproteobacteria bacterium]|nr:alpha/beta hydrolase [Alphaproteobacteria bacterium]